MLALDQLDTRERQAWGVMVTLRLEHRYPLPATGCTRSGCVALTNGLAAGTVTLRERARGAIVITWSRTSPYH